MRVLLVCSDPGLEGRVEPCLRQGTPLEQVSADGIVDETGSLSPHGRTIADSVDTETVVLIEWEFDAAPALNVLTHAVRERRLGPCIMLSDRVERPEALGAGADSVLNLPFAPAHLEGLVLAHRRLVQVTEASLRRELGDEKGAKPVLEVAGVKLERSTLTVWFGEQQTRVTPRESGLLSYLMQHADRVCTREELLSKVWGIRFDTGTNMVDVYVFFVRRKLQALGVGEGIATVRGAGYRFVGMNGSAEA